VFELRTSDLLDAVLSDIESRWSVFVKTDLEQRPNLKDQTWKNPSPPPRTSSSGSSVDAFEIEYSDEEEDELVNGTDTTHLDNVDTEIIVDDEFISSEHMNGRSPIEEDFDIIANHPRADKKTILTMVR
jgi:hypothetical protein